MEGVTDAIMLTSCRDPSSWLGIVPARASLGAKVTPSPRRWYPHDPPEGYHNPSSTSDIPGDLWPRGPFQRVLRMCVCCEEVWLLCGVGAELVQPGLSV